MPTWAAAVHAGRTFSTTCLVEARVAATSFVPFHRLEAVFNVKVIASREDSAGAFKSRSPDTLVKGIAVAWVSYAVALKLALGLNCNLFITHAPTYCGQREELFRFENTPKKRDFIRDSGIVILRCRGVWEQYPKLGSPDAWAGALGFSKPVAGSGYFRVFDVSGRTAIDVARQAALDTLPLGQVAVQLIGPSDAPVHRLAIDCGAITPFLRFVQDFKAELAICTGDGFTYWRDGAFSLDSVIPPILVNQPVSEVRGMARCSAGISLND